MWNNNLKYFSIELQHNKMWRRKKKSRGLNTLFLLKSYIQMNTFKLKCASLSGEKFKVWFWHPKLTHCVGVCVYTWQTSERIPVFQKLWLLSSTVTSLLIVFFCLIFCRASCKSQFLDTVFTPLRQCTYISPNLWTKNSSHSSNSSCT